MIKRFLIVFMAVLLLVQPATAGCFGFQVSGFESKAIVNLKPETRNSELSADLFGDQALEEPLLMAWRSMGRLGLRGRHWLSSAVHLTRPAATLAHILQGPACFNKKGTRRQVLSRWERDGVRPSRGGRWPGLLPLYRRARSVLLGWVVLPVGMEGGLMIAAYLAAAKIFAFSLRGYSFPALLTSAAVIEAWQWVHGVAARKQASSTVLKQALAKDVTVVAFLSFAMWLLSVLFVPSSGALPLMAFLIPHALVGIYVAGMLSLVQAMIHSALRKKGIDFAAAPSLNAFSLRMEEWGWDGKAPIRYRANQEDRKIVGAITTMMDAFAPKRSANTPLARALHVLMVDRTDTVALQDLRDVAIGGVAWVIGFDPKDLFSSSEWERLTIKTPLFNRQRHTLGIKEQAFRRIAPPGAASPPATASTGSSPGKPSSFSRTLRWFSQAA